MLRALGATCLLAILLRCWAIGDGRGPVADRAVLVPGTMVPPECAWMWAAWLTGPVLALAAAVTQSTAGDRMRWWWWALLVLFWVVASLLALGATLLITLSDSLDDVVVLEPRSEQGCRLVLQGSDVGYGWSGRVGLVTPGAWRSRPVGERIDWPEGSGPHQDGAWRIDWAGELAVLTMVGDDGTEQQTVVDCG